MKQHSKQDTSSSLQHQVPLEPSLFIMQLKYKFTLQETNLIKYTIISFIILSKLQTIKIKKAIYEKYYLLLQNMKTKRTPRIRKMTISQYIQDRLKSILSMVRLSQSRTNVNTAYFTVTYILIFLNQKPTNAFERNFRIQRPVLKIVALIARKTNQRKNKKECKYQKMPYKACPSQMLNFYFLGIINTNQFIKKSRTSTPHIYSNSNCRT
eukprot:TRINITY_DN18893_c0_g1_i5.p1 TRINITY_DN18893_c0_g1~~TRINITY_DN18893_c0_g1_i5.p1  ORF type:complete len:210 (+),score=-18.06 TRINITY_DN18893_c0_g1_i5:879-1508(+)